MCLCFQEQHIWLTVGGSEYVAPAAVYPDVPALSSQYVLHLQIPHDWQMVSAITKNQEGISHICYIKLDGYNPKNFFFFFFCLSQPKPGSRSQYMISWFSLCTWCEIKSPHCAEFEPCPPCAFPKKNLPHCVCEASHECLHSLLLLQLIQRRTYRPGVGVTKLISSVPLFSEFFSVIKTHVIYWRPRLFFTGVTAAQLRWHLSNINVIKII